MKILITFFFFALASLGPVSGAEAAITNVNQCKGGNQGKDIVLAPEQLLQERLYINSLYTKRVAKDLEIKNNKDETRKKQLEAERDAINREIESAVKNCGGTLAGLADAQKKLDEAVNNALYFRGDINNYSPIAPLPFGNGGKMEIADLVSNGFKFAVGIAALLSVIMIVYRSLTYILSGDSFSGKKFSTEKIQDSLIGFLIILCSIVVLRTIDPNIINLNFNPSTPGLKDISDSPEEKELLRRSNEEQRKLLGGLSSVGGGDSTNTGTGTSFNNMGTNTGTGIPGGGVTRVPLGNDGKPTGSGTGNTRPGTIKPGTNNPNQPPVNVIFCYTFKRKTDNTVQRKCVSGFENCVTDKKITRKNPAFYRFTQCKINLKP